MGRVLFDPGQPISHKPSYPQASSRDELSRLTGLVASFLLVDCRTSRLQHYCTVLHVLSSLIQRNPPAAPPPEFLWWCLLPFRLLSAVIPRVLPVLEIEDKDRGPLAPLDRGGRPADNVRQSWWRNIGEIFTVLPAVMAPSIFRRAGYDLSPEPNLDALSKAYITFVVVWTLILIAGVACLIKLRNLTFIRMRNVTLAASAVSTIHVYLVLASLVYTLNGMYPCVFEFWVMSTYFPFGVALFQAQNLQLLELSCLQKQLILDPLKVKAPLNKKGLAGLRQRWSRMGMVSRTYLCIGVGIALQVRMQCLSSS